MVALGTTAGVWQSVPASPSTVVRLLVGSSCLLPCYLRTLCRPQQRRAKRAAAPLNDRKMIIGKLPHRQAGLERLQPDWKGFGLSSAVRKSVVKCRPGCWATRKGTTAEFETSSLRCLAMIPTVHEDLGEAPFKP